MGRSIDFVELLIQGAQDQGWLAKNRELKFIPELLSMQSDATGYLLEFMFQQLVEDEKMATTFTFMMTRYLFAKSIEATIAWGHSKDGKISIYYHTKHLIDKQL